MTMCKIIDINTLMLNYITLNMLYACEICFYSLFLLAHLRRKILHNCAQIG